MVFTNVLLIMILLWNSQMKRWLIYFVSCPGYLKSIIYIMLEIFHVYMHFNCINFNVDSFMYNIKLSTLKLTRFYQDYQTLHSLKVRYFKKLIARSPTFFMKKMKEALNSSWKEFCERGKKSCYNCQFCNFFTTSRDEAKISCYNCQNTWKNGCG